MRLIGCVFRGRYSGLLISLLVFLVVAPSLEEHPIVGFIVPLFFASVLLAGLYPIIRSREYVRSAVLLLSIHILARLLSYFVADIYLLLLVKLTGVLFLTLTLLAILRAIFKETEVSADTIAGSVCVYVLIGVTWASLYVLVEILNPGSFALQGQTLDPLGFERIRGSIFPEFIYFSFITLTTLGYGDIAPMSRFARSAAIVEALVGPIYLAVLVARLVGLYIGARKGDRVPD